MSRLSIMQSANQSGRHKSSAESTVLPDKKRSTFTDKVSAGQKKKHHGSMLRAIKGKGTD